MTDLTYQSPLTQSGLTAHQAALYEILIKSGAMPASKIGLVSGLSRPLAYKVLDELIALELAEKHEEPKKVALFNAVHPIKLKETVEKRLEMAQSAKANLETILGKLTSDFNLVSGKSGVQFFEGIGGIEQVLNDSLTSSSEIYTYADIEAIDTYIPEINRAYVAKREKLQIKKKGIAFDTPATRYFLEGYHQEVTKMKLINWHAVPFKTIMQIYDGKVSYFTLGEENLVGVIITDPHIYQMHRDMFEFLWNSPITHSPAESTPANP
jgi:sugar-specific transcriptional regulator TrmB